MLYINKENFLDSTMFSKDTKPEVKAAIILSVVSIITCLVTMTYTIYLHNENKGFKTMSLAYNQCNENKGKFVSALGIILANSYHDGTQHEKIDETISALVDLASYWELDVNQNVEITEHIKGLRKWKSAGVHDKDSQNLFDNYRDDMTKYLVSINHIDCSTIINPAKAAR